jgi:polar amino acid transport system substrate-binding protein
MFNRRFFMRTAPAVPLAAGAMLAAAPTQAVAQTVDDLIKKGKLTVAIDTTTAPYGMLDDQMQPSGFDIDFARLMAASLKSQIEFVTVNSPGRIPALLTNRVDLVISIFSITPERAQQVSFSIPYAGQSSVLVAPKALQAKGYADLVGKKIAITRGALEDIALTNAQKKFPGITILRFDDYPSTAQAMLSGQVDAMGGGDYGEIYLKKSSKGDEFEQKFPLRAAHFGVGMRRGNPDLLHWINTFIYSVKNDGTLDDLSMKWRKAPLPPLPVF